jgi:hypothetical protein
MKYVYGNEKLSLAVYILSKSTQSLQDCLADAYAYQVSYVDEHHVPGSVWNELNSIKQRLEKQIEDPAGESWIFINAGTLDTSEAERITESIVSAALQTRVAFLMQKDPD